MRSLIFNFNSCFGRFRVPRTTLKLGDLGFLELSYHKFIVLVDCSSLVIEARNNLVSEPHCDQDQPTMSDKIFEECLIEFRCHLKEWRDEIAACREQQLISITTSENPSTTQTSTEPPRTTASPQPY